MGQTYNETAGHKAGKQHAFERIGSETLLAKIIEFYPDAMLIVDEAGRVIAWNKAMEAMTGVGAKEIIGKGDYEYALPFYGERRPILLDLLDAPVATIGDLYTEVTIHDGKLEATALRVKLKGKEVILWGVAGRLFDADGKAVGAIESIRDVTDIKRAETALRDQNMFLQTLINALPMPIFYKNPEGVYIGCNKAFETFVGLAKDRIEGKTVYDVSPKELADIYRGTDQALFRGGGIQEYEGRVKYADGTAHDVIFYKAPFFNADGTLGGLIGAILDITERKRMLEELKKHRHDLEGLISERTADLQKVNEALQREIVERRQAEEALREAKAQAELYVDLMGHDINNMNQVAMGYLELAQDAWKEGRSGPDNQLLISKPLEMLGSCSMLIDNIRKLQRAVSGGYRPETIDLGKMLREVWSQYSSSANREIVINYVPVEGCFVKANELLRDVFLNLVGNAIKHSTGPLTIDIGLERVNEDGRGYFRVFVEDNGPGITDDLKIRLFDRLSLERTKASGKGFGLCLIKRLVDDYHGRFWVEDRVPGDHTKGCRFVVLLPALE